MKKSDTNKTKSDSKVVKKTIMIIILIIIIILLITSCTSGLWGKIGDDFFGKSSYVIDEEGQKEEIKNAELQFINKKGNTNLGEVYKIEFSTTEIMPEEYSCITSDANIATCVVQGNYVDVYTKNTGTVIISVLTETNGKKYIGTHELTINKITRRINLEANEGTLNIATSDTKKIRYSLENIVGDIQIEVSDEKIAKASIKNNMIYIKAYKTGNVKVTLKINYNGKEYKNTYNLNIIDKKTETITKSNDNYLNKIESNYGNLNPTFDKEKNEYSLEVNAKTDKISLNISKSSDKATIYYYLNDKKINTLKDISLNYGINTIKIGVLAENGEIRIYQVIITRPKPVIDPTENSNKLTSITTTDGQITPTFDKNINNYSIVVPYEQEKISFKTALESKNATISYKYNNQNIKDLNNLSLKEGNNKVEINVTGKDGKKNTYIINVYREYKTLSNTNTLENIILSKGTLNPKFEKETTSYSVNVNTDDEYIDIEAIKTDSNSSIKYQVNGKNASSLSNVKLNKGNNLIVISITSESGETKEYSININREKSNVSTLENITTSNGELSPNFSKNINNYNLNLKYDVNNITLVASKTSEYSTIQYYYNGIKINNLKDLVVKEGITNKLEIKVTAENGTENVYSVSITRALDDRNTLKNLNIEGFELNEVFNSNINNYSTKVFFDTTTIKINAEALSPKASIKYYNASNNKTEINNNVVIDEGNNIIEIEVTSQSGVKNSYFIEIYRPTRNIKFVEDNLIIYRESGTVDIPFEVYEDNILLTKEDYSINDIKIESSDFKGKLEINDSSISITPSNEDINKESTITITYNNTNDSIKIKVLINEYYLNLNATTYDMDYINNEDNTRDIIFNTNIFNNDIKIINTENGIKLINDKGYITIETEDKDIISILYSNNSNLNTTNYIEFTTKAKKEGKAKIILSGEIYGKELPTKEITINITTKYIFVIDANEGTFNTFANKYTYKYAKNQIVDLSKYTPYKEADGNCNYFVLDKFNTKKDATGIDYDKNEIITITNDLTIYAIYKNTAEKVEIKENNIIYLTDVDLFYNEEYYKKYNIEKIIYPGATGSHVMTINNITENPIKITKINIEEDTMCLNNPSGCINMAYIVKSTFKNINTYKYHYGRENKYQILNKDSDLISSNIGNKYHNKKVITLEEPIEVLPGEENEIYISLLWTWIEDNDSLDTAIGSIKDDVNYGITISIEYEQINKHCIINK